MCHICKLVGISKNKVEHIIRLTTRVHGQISLNFEKNIVNFHIYRSHHIKVKYGEIQFSLVLQKIVINSQILILYFLI